MSRPQAVVIGAGVGGLTAALALYRRGWHITVLERAPTLAPRGAALVLAPNAQHALGALGLGDAVTALATWRGDGSMRDPRGRPLARTGSRSVLVARFGVPLAVLRHRDLVDLIVDRLPADAVRTGQAAFLTSSGSAEHKARVATPQGMREADLVVAADGINSASRDILFPRHPVPKYGGWTAWCIRAPAPGPDVLPHRSWGSGQVWGTLIQDRDSVFSYACAATEEGGRSPDGEKAELLRRFGHWHDPVPTLIESVGEDEILRHDVYHLAVPLTSFHRGRTTLLGDAAHAMAPILCQGVGLAIEDGVVLAHHAVPGRDLRTALAAYDRDRRPRTTAMARRAERILKLTSLHSRAAVATRDAMVRAASTAVPGLLLRGFCGFTDWYPPTADDSRGMAAGRAPS